MRREPRITMAREVLTISTTKVTVDYDFRNDTDANITTEVAFPIPPYSADTDERPTAELGFDDFKLWVNGQPKLYSTEVRGFVGSRDVSQLIKRNRLSIADFGQDTSGRTDQIKKLPPAQLARLLKLGLIIHDQYNVYYAAWSAEKRYYWLQTFPANGMVHIRHEYTPLSGFTSLEARAMKTSSATQEHDPTLRQQLRDERSGFHSFCPTDRAMDRIGKSNGLLELSSVDFILTTANTWKRPIEDFTLVVERADPKNTISFCWDGPVEQLDANHFQAHATNLIPTKELHIGFYHLNTTTF
jgi:hypothetical protein